MIVSGRMRSTRTILVAKGEREIMLSHCCSCNAWCCVEVKFVILCWLPTRNTGCTPYRHVERKSLRHRSNSVPVRHSPVRHTAVAIEMTPTRRDLTPIPTMGRC